jgi:hypothetical protein
MANITYIAGSPVRVTAVLDDVVNLTAGDADVAQQMVG